MSAQEFHHPAAFWGLPGPRCVASSQPSQVKAPLRSDAPAPEGAASSQAQSQPKLRTWSLAGRQAHVDRWLGGQVAP